MTEPLPNTHSLKQTDSPLDCPVCGKRAVHTIECSRCGSHLASLRKINDGAHSFAVLAHRAIATMDSGKAAEYALRSRQLHKNVTAARIAFFAAVIEGRFDDAKTNYLIAVQQ